MEVKIFNLQSFLWLKVSMFTVTCNIQGQILQYRVSAVNFQLSIVNLSKLWKMLWVQRQFPVQSAAPCKQRYASYLQDTMTPVVQLVICLRHWH